jgi:ATP-binding cassette, subfamily A (ABC1), member 3
MSSKSFDIGKPSSLTISLDSYLDTVTLLKNEGNDTRIVDSLKSLLSEKDSIEVVDEDMNSHFLTRANESLALVSKYLIGMSIEENQIDAWFNGEPLHTMPLTLNYINRAILKTLAGNDFDISLTNKPFEQNNPFEVQGGFNMTSLVFLMVFLFLLMIYWPSVFIAFYIKERESRAKLLQFISGANRFVYWFTSFLIDYLIFIVIICAIIGGIGLYQREHLSTAAELGSLFTILAFYAFTTLPMVYALSYMFSKHTTGETMVTVFGFLCKLKNSF